MPSGDKSRLLRKPHDIAPRRYPTTAPVDAYTPNGYGLYNMAGNIAEMIAQPGIAKGGNWASPGYYLRIEAEEAYSGPSAKVGFRVFMEVF